MLHTLTATVRTLPLLPSVFATLRIFSWGMALLVLTVLPNAALLTVSLLFLSWAWSFWLLGFVFPSARQVSDRLTSAAYGVWGPTMRLFRWVDGRMFPGRDGG